MKVLLITPDFPPEVGGIQTILYNTVKNISGIEVVAPHVIGDIEFDKNQGFKIYRVPFIRFYKKSVLLPIFLKTLLINPDLIVCGHILPGIIGFIMKKIYNTPYIIYTYAIEIMNKKYNPFISIILGNADIVIVPSEFTKKYVLSLKVDECKVIKIYPGVDTSLFNPAIDATRVKEKYKLWGKSVLLTIARMEKREQYKGHDMVLKSLPIVLRQIANLVYLIVGDGSDRPRLIRKVNEMGLEACVIFTGYIPHIETPKFYAACDVFVMVSNEEVSKYGIKAEGFGVVFAEANACGKPVIGGNSGGIPDAVIDGVTGILVNPNDPKEIANAIIKLLTDKGLANKMGGAGRSRVVNELDARIIAQKVEKIIKSTLSNKRCV